MSNFEDNIGEDSDSDDNTPVLKKLVVEYEFPETGTIMKEEMTITKNGGVFGEGMARLNITADIDSDSQQATVDMPVPQWAGRFLAVLSKTCNAELNSDKSDVTFEKEKVIKHRYIFKR